MSGTIICRNVSGVWQGGGVVIRIRQQYNIKGKTRQHFTKTWINIGKRQNHCVLSQVVYFASRTVLVVIVW